MSTSGWRSDQREPEERASVLRPDVAAEEAPEELAIADYVGVHRHSASSVGRARVQSNPAPPTEGEFPATSSGATRAGVGRQRASGTDGVRSSMSPYPPRARNSSQAPRLLRRGCNNGSRPCCIDVNGDGGQSRATGRSTTLPGLWMRSSRSPRSLVTVAVLWLLLRSQAERPARRRPLRRALARAGDSDLRGVGIFAASSPASSCRSPSAPSSGAASSAGSSPVSRSSLRPGSSTTSVT